MRTLKTILFWLCSPVLVVLGLAFISVVMTFNTMDDLKKSHE